MRFATILNSGRRVTVVERDGLLVDLDALASTRFPGGPVCPAGRGLVRCWEGGDPFIRDLARAATTRPLPELATVEPASATFLAPIPDARLILAVGLNYRAHCLEQGREIPETPMFFAKLVSALSGHGAPITHWPITSQLDYEGELAVIIGKGGRGIPESEALSYCFGYSIANDVTARDLQRGDRQWTRGKGLDGFCPMGPFMVTRDEIPDPQGLRIRTWVNGELRQEAPTSDMALSVARIVSVASEAITLEPGDIVITGTPSGVGVFRDPPTFLVPGDRVRIGIDGIGELENHVIAG
jgi:2-keto-4-pentenoate hydratase/2-oxohepta-3-ene-1,7-dioic acid hydratase in catechol pathway